MQNALAQAGDGSDTHARRTRQKRSSADAMAPYTAPWASPLRSTLETQFLSVMGERGLV